MDARKILAQAHDRETLELCFSQIDLSMKIDDIWWLRARYGEFLDDHDYELLMQLVTELRRAHEFYAEKAKKLNEALEKKEVGLVWYRKHPVTKKAYARFSVIDREWLERYLKEETRICSVSELFEYDEKDDILTQIGEAALKAGANKYYFEEVQTR